MKRTIIFLIIIFSAFMTRAYAGNINVSENNTIADDGVCFYAVSKDGSLYGWKYEFIATKDIQRVKIMDDVVSVCQNYAVKSNGTLWTWDNKSYIPIYVTDNVKSISVGCNTHVLVLKKDGSLWGKEDNEYGQLAQGEIVDEKNVNRPRIFTIHCTPDYYDNLVKIMNDVKSAKAGVSHSIVLKNDGSVWTFGSNFFGESGQGENCEINNIPIKILDSAENIFAGAEAGFAIINKNVWHWGTNYNGYVGVGPNECSFEPIPYITKRRIKNIVGCPRYNLVICKDNSLWVYGDSEHTNKVYLSSRTMVDGSTKICDDIDDVSRAYYTEDIEDRIIVLRKNGEADILQFSENVVDDSTPLYRSTRLSYNIRLSNENPLIKNFGDIYGCSMNTKNAINSLAKAGIVEGMTDTEFAPDNSMTRAEIAKLLLRMTAKDETGINSEFSDVTKDMWYYYVAGASKKYNIVQGFEDNTFRGDDEISNIQFVALCARTLMKEKEIEVDSSLKINTVPEWAEKEATVAVQEGLISESDTALMAPDEPITRGEATVILYELYNRV